MKKAGLSKSLLPQRVKGFCEAFFLLAGFWPGYEKFPILAQQFLY
jgi:hypothetical protein